VSVRRTVVGAALLLLPLPAISQGVPELDIRLTIDAASATRTLDLLEQRSGFVRDIAALPGSRLALAAAAALSGRRLDVPDLERSLEDARFGAPQPDDPLGMDDARVRVREVRQLLTEILRRSFATRVAGTVAQLFPPHADVHAVIPVYFVAFGPQTIDAFVQRVTWDGDEPEFRHDGRLTIVMNLTRSVVYGRSTDERLLATLSTVTHEVFHAAFGAYQDSSDVWRAFRRSHRGYLIELLELTQNEGLAHYLSFEQRGGFTPSDWDTRVRGSVDQFNRSAEELASHTIGRERAGELLRASNTSAYWESYGAITGLFIARAIDRIAGRPALAATVAEGPLAFFAAYDRLCARDSNLPRLGGAVRSLLKP
jgi:hypothetical protein